MSKIKIFGLGGLNENGKNMYVVKVDEDIFVFDAGLKYASESHLGIDYIIPNFDYIKNNIKNVKGIFLTHGHEKNMGAVIDIITELPDINIYATKFTANLLKREMQEFNIQFKNLHTIEPHKKIAFGVNSIFPVRLTHSIPDAVGYALNTRDGAIFYTGNYVFDATMQGNYKTDVGKLAYIGKQGVLCLLSESVYADKSGYTSPQHRITDVIKKTLNKVPTRIIFAVYAENLYNLQELFNEVSKTHRKVVVMGKKLQSIVNDYIDTDYIKFDKKNIGDLNNINDKDSIILISNDREKPFINLHRIINGYDKYIKLTSNDTVFLLDPITDSTEKIAITTVDAISKIGAEIITLSRKNSLQHHASSEDIMLMLGLMNPKYYFPVIGEYRYQVANANNATLVGIKKENIFLKQNGDVVYFENGKHIDEKERVKVDDILIDGKSSQDIGELVLKDREALSGDGIVVVCATIDRQTKAILSGPEILTKGFIYVKGSTELIDKIKEISIKVINNNIEGSYVDFNKIKQGVRNDLGRYLYYETESRPMIITVIQEV